MLTIYPCLLYVSLQLNFVIIAVLSITELPISEPANSTNGNINHGIDESSESKYNATREFSLINKSTTTLRPRIPMKCEDLLLGQYPSLYI